MPLPTNENENDDLTRFIVNADLPGQTNIQPNGAPVSANFWLRLDDTIIEGQYVDSSSKKKVEYFNWMPNQPNNWMNQDHIAINTDGKWHDLGEPHKCYTLCTR